MFSETAIRSSDIYLKFQKVQHLTTDQGTRKFNFKENITCIRQIFSFRIRYILRPLQQTLNSKGSSKTLAGMIHFYFIECYSYNKSKY